MADIMNNAERAEEFAKLEREFNNNSREINMMIQMAQAAALENREERNPSAILREVLQGTRMGTQKREITLGTQITASGAIALSIHDVLDTSNIGNQLPGGMIIPRGVVGNQLWPVSINDVEFEEVAENVELTDQKLDFDKITATARDGGITVWISNDAIDQADFDLMSFVKEKFRHAEGRYLAKKLYSQAAFTGNKGAFSGLTPKGTITLDATAYKNILKAVAAFTDNGIEGDNFYIIMGATTEAELKATPKANGQGGFIIENGKCAGYNYIVTPHINTTSNSEGKIVATEDKFIGFGYFDYMSVQQHGTVRMSIDSQSASVAKRNQTAITLFTAYSMTDVSTKLNGNKSGKTQAFALYEVVEPAAE